MRVNELYRSATNSYESVLAEKRLAFLTNVGKLEALNPLSVMSRGYSVTQRNGKTVSDISDVSVGDVITVRLKDGKINATVESTTSDLEN